MVYARGLQQGWVYCNFYMCLCYNTPESNDQVISKAWLDTEEVVPPFDSGVLDLNQPGHWALQTGVARLFI